HHLGADRFTDYAQHYNLLGAELEVASMAPVHLDFAAGQDAAVRAVGHLGGDIGQGGGPAAVHGHEAARIAVDPGGAIDVRRDVGGGVPAQADGWVPPPQLRQPLNVLEDGRGLLPLVHHRAVVRVITALGVVM